MNLKKICAIIMVCIMVCILPTTTYAASKKSVLAPGILTMWIKHKVDLSGYKKYKDYKASTYMKGTISWLSLYDGKFSGTTGGEYKGSTKADSIVHTDYVTVSGIGTTSVTGGYKSLTSGFAYATSTAQYEYTAYNTKSITNYTSYVAAKGMTTNFEVTSATKYTWGNVNIRTIPGDGN